MIQSLMINLRNYMEKVTNFALNRLLVPLVLALIYSIGIGFTRVLMIFSKSPLQQRAGQDSYWRDINLGTELDKNREVPSEDRYLRQS